MSGIDTVITNHFEMFLRDMLYQPFNKIESRYGFGNKLVIFMAVIVESDHFTVVRINAGGSDNGSAEISADIFDDMLGITFMWFGINVEAVFRVGIDGGLNFFKGIADTRMEFIEQGGLKSVAEKNVVKVRFSAPNKRAANAAFRNKAMNVRIPFEIASKGMENADEARSKPFGFIVLVKEAQNNTAHGGKEAVKERTVVKKEIP